MGTCPGGITIASSAQNETICSTSPEAEAAADHAASTRSSSARPLSIFRLSFNPILLYSWLHGSDKYGVPENSLDIREEQVPIASGSTLDWLISSGITLRSHSS